MDTYFDQDKDLVVSEFKKIKEKLARVCSDESTKEQVMEALQECLHNVCVLRFKLKHVDNMDSTSVSEENKAGLSVLKGTIKQLCEDIDQSLEDTSWIEDTDSFAENQRNAVRDMIDVITKTGISGSAKQEADAQVAAMQKLTPPEGAEDWVIRSMRNEMMLMGITSQLHHAIVSVSEL